MELFLDLRALFLLLWPFLVFPLNFAFSEGARTNSLSSRASGSGSVVLHLIPTSSWIRLYCLFWDLRTSETTVPVDPALAVLPLLCLYALPSSGGSKCITQLTSSTSIPLDATSVAIMTLACPALNLCIDLSRCFCFMPPWSVVNERSISLISSPSLLTPALVRQKMMLRPHFSAMYEASSALPLELIFQKKCCMLSMLTSSGPIPTLSGSSWYDSTISDTSSSRVALNRIVCLSCLHLSMIERTGCMKPMSAILSASSSTTMPTSSSRRAPLSRRSISLPGHATSISTPLFSLLYWPL